ncbi:MAG: hypothetical protein ACXU82_04670 [Caulobacteraceae bacterium]
MFTGGWKPEFILCSCDVLEDKMELAITTRDRHAEFDLFDTTTMNQTTTAVLMEGVTVKYEGTLMRKALDFPSVIELSVSFGGGVASSIVASAIWEWLRKKLKKAPERLEIDRVFVEFEEGEVKRLIRERIQAEKAE